MKFKRILGDFLLWILIGILCGVVGSVFSKTVGLVTNVRLQNGWLICFLPIAGLLSVAVCNLCKTQKVSTVDVFCSAKQDKKLPLLLAPAVFLATAITHLFGGSAGKEGAALQIGGGISAVVSKVFKVSQKTRNTLILCGMAGLFSAAFGTPFAAAVFAIEAVRLKKRDVLQILPCLVSGLVAFVIALGLKTEAERFHIGTIPDVNFKTCLIVLLISVSAALVGVVFCKSLHFVHKLFEKIIKNGYLRVFVGGAIVVLLTIVIGNGDYNGSSAQKIAEIFETGNVRYEAFALKIIFTVITMGCGFKGGEIVPTLVIGSALGGAIAMLTGIAVPFCAAIGIAALFCCVTKCPVTSVVICLELFSFKAPVFIIFAVLISFLLSGKSSLYGDINPLIKITKNGMQ